MAVTSLQAWCCNYVEAAFINGSWSWPPGEQCLPECLGWRIHQGPAMTPVAENACFWKRLAFGLVDGAKIILTKVGGQRGCVEGPEGTKRQRKGKLLSVLPELGHPSSPAAPTGAPGSPALEPGFATAEPSPLRPMTLDWKLHHRLPLHTGLNLTTSVPGPAACRWRFMELVSLPNHMSQSPS